ncbi:MAG TPA: replication initiator, partial [Chloroflexota bacterium]|nr:replication initiator [Chloroflexota bacterium]
HAKAMIRTCWTLGGVPELQHLRLRPWAHMLGFRGHFSSKSRRYSTTLGCLRSARRNWRTNQALRPLGLDQRTTVYRCHAEDFDGFDDHQPDDQDVVLVVGHWLYAGRGHSPGQAIYAQTIAEDIANNRRIARATVREEDIWDR